MENSIAIGQYTIECNEQELTAKCWKTKKTGKITVMFNYRFKTADNMAKYVTDYTKSIFSQMQLQQTRKVQRANDKKNHGIEVGQVYYTSWGYDQTNVSFYLITSVKGQKIEFVKVGQETKDTNWDYGYAMPNTSCIISETMTAMATGKNTFNVKSRYSARLHNGKPKYYSTGY